MDKNRRDNSGVRLYFTPTLREYDLGLLTTGVDATPMSIQIPGETDELKITHPCYKQCTEVDIALIDRSYFVKLSCTSFF